MNILWIEDFGGDLPAGRNILNQMFGDLMNFDKWDNDELSLTTRPADLNEFCSQQKSLHTIYLCRNYFDYMTFKNEHAVLNEIDLVISDINLENRAHVSLDLPIPESYSDKTKFHQYAGFFIFNDLIYLGFPEAQMCFMTGEKNSFTGFAEKCRDNYMPPVKGFEKSPTDYENLRAWIREKETDYSKLRRGIIAGCNYLKTLTENELRFNDFIKEDDKKIGLEDLVNYVGVLENFLPLQEPKNKERFYKLFVRTLAHEWEAAEPKRLNGQNELFAFSWIMKMSRNWLAHSKIFEKLTAQDVAYLFMVNIRTMFDLGDKLVGYEKILLNLFKPISAMELKEKIGNDFKDRKLPLVENYAQVLKATGNTYQAINFHDALSNLQRNKINENQPEFFIKGLYQTFWFLTSNGGVFIPSDEQVKKFSVLNYQFRYFDYSKTKFLFEFCKHIYNRSFS